MSLRTGVLRTLVPACALILGPAGTACAAAAPDTSAMRGALEMMRRTERAFARTTAEIGVRNGFGMFFADDAIMPPDSAGTNRFLAGPAPVAPTPTTLEWEPLTGEVSRSLDLGWLTGPFSFRDTAGKQHHGVYFSIWRRGANGLWRVALDAVRAAGADAELRRTETAFLAAAAHDPRGAYAGALAGSARLHRDGRIPLIARDSILALVAGERTSAGHVIRAEVSSAGDLGWTFGVATYRAERGVREAAFTRIWRRDPEGRWRIVLDVSSPAGD